MAKSDTILRYRDEFLQGRSQEYIDKFNLKSEDRQYSSIMAWRHKSRCKERESITSANVLEQINATRSKLASLPSVSQEEIEKIEKEISSLADFCAELRRKHREEEIRRLETEQSRIADRLRKLRGEECSRFE